jgi:hypothetical protein
MCPSAYRVFEMLTMRLREGNKVCLEPQNVHLQLSVYTNIPEYFCKLPTGSVDGLIGPLMASPLMRGESAAGVGLIWIDRCPLHAVTDLRIGLQRLAAVMSKEWPRMTLAYAFKARMKFPRWRANVAVILQIEFAKAVTCGINFVRQLHHILYNLSPRPNLRQD